VSSPTVATNIMLCFSVMLLSGCNYSIALHKTGIDQYVNTSGTSTHNMSHVGIFSNIFLIYNLFFIFFFLEKICIQTKNGRFSRSCWCKRYGMLQGEH